MKTFTLIAAMLFGAAASVVSAQEAHTGLYIGAACDVRWIDGTGTWSVYDFDADQYLSDESPVGLAWSDHYLLGVRPSVGFRLSRAFALEAGLGLHIPKSSKQSAYESTTNYYYEQGMTIEWHQRVIDVLGIWRPSVDSRFYLQAGVEWHAVTVDVLLWEGAQFGDELGDLVGIMEYDDHSDKTDAVGFVVGVSFEAGLRYHLF